MSLRLNINGEERSSTADPMTPLVDVLRDEFFLTGAKPVCREGFCGACTVMVDGQAVMSCLVPVGLADGRAVTHRRIAVPRTMPCRRCSRRWRIMTRCSAACAFPAW